MKLMIETMTWGRRSSRRPSTSSWNGVVNASRSAACTQIQLRRAIVANITSPSPLMVSVTGPSDSVPSGSPLRVKISGSAARRNGAARNARRAGRNVPTRAIVAAMSTSTHAMRIARNEPIGSRLTATMNTTVARNFARGSARCSGLSRGR